MRTTLKRLRGLAALAAVALWACTTKADGLPGWAHPADGWWRCEKTSCVDMNPKRARVMQAPPHGRVVALAMAWATPQGLQPVEASMMIYCDAMAEPVAMAVVAHGSKAPIPWERPVKGSVSDLVTLVNCEAQKGKL